MTNWIYSLRDPLDPWLGEDKLLHFACSALWWRVLERLAAAHLPGFLAPLFAQPLPWFAAAAIGVELVEVWRYRRWVAKGKPLPWPWLTDKVSVKDLMADALGAVVAWLL